MIQNHLQYLGKCLLFLQLKTNIIHIIIRQLYLKIYFYIARNIEIIILQYFK